MTLDRFEEAWRADKSSTSIEELTRTLRHIEREGRFQTALQYVCAAITLGMTAVITFTVSGRGLLRVATGVASMCVLMILFRSRIERRRRFQSLFRSVNDAAAAALQDTSEQIKHLKTLAGLERKKICQTRSASRFWISGEVQ